MTASSRSRRCGYRGRVRCRVAAPNAGLLVVAIYAVAYLVWDPMSGSSWALCVGLPLWLAANYARHEVRHTRVL